MARTASVIFSDMEQCIVCGSPYVEVHHIFPGTANRKISDRYGYVAPLCQYHHTGTAEGVHHNKDFMKRLKQEAQKHYEANHGTRKDFIKTFGKSYL